MHLKKRFIPALLIFLGVLFSFNGIFSTTVSASTEMVYAGGFPAGFLLQMDGVQVVGLSDVITKDGLNSPAKKCGLKAGDVIVEFNGHKITEASDIEKYCAVFQGKCAPISYFRKGELLSTTIEPAKDFASGAFRLGVLIRDSISGIGTVTYVRQNGSFGALGHPVFSENGEIMKIAGGKSFKCSIIGVNRGEKGAPGELRGLFYKEQSQGAILKNTQCGIFGKFDISDFKTKELFPVANISEVKIGKATIITTIDGETPTEYAISIVKIDRNNKDNKNFVIKITDKDLINETNGIVQGMSGSPIIQNGKIIGAVTHVFVNDPERGYGISIQKMLQEEI
ncbi:MAG: SpoIVB peptidase [Clostridiales bacterium]|nr:SpoIVB peptidase [Clostridiales bacterium]